MILGAGIYQLPLIRKARQRGFEVLVASTPGPYPGIAEADRFLPLDTTDIPQVLKACAQEQIAGIVTTGSDVCVPTVGAVVDALVFRHPPPPELQIRFEYGVLV